MSDEAVDKIRLLAYEWAARNRLDRVEPLARELLQHDPSDMDGLRFLWQASHARGDALAAEGLSASFVQHHEQVADGHHMASIDHAIRGNEERARRHADRALELEPENPKHHAHLALLLFDIGEVSQADTAAASALAKDPLEPNALSVAARCAIVLGHRERAEAAIRQLLTIGTDDSFAMSDAGNLLINFGRRATGIDILRSVLRRDPNSCRLHMAIGYALLSRGDWITARQHFREVLRLRPDLEQVRRLLRMGSRTPPPMMPEGWTMQRWIETSDDDGRTIRIALDED
jgi:Flp pilus assembly protein TadD